MRCRRSRRAIAAASWPSVLALRRCGRQLARHEDRLRRGATLERASASWAEASLTFNSSRSWPFLTGWPSTALILSMKVSSCARTVEGAIGSTFPLLEIEEMTFFANRSDREILATGWRPLRRTSAKATMAASARKSRCDFAACGPLLLYSNCLDGLVNAEPSGTHAQRSSLSL